MRGDRAGFSGISGREKVFDQSVENQHVILPRDMKPEETGRYRCNIIEETRNILYYSVYILIFFEKPMSLAVGDLTDDIECVELQPPGEIASDAWFGIDIFGLRQE